MQCSDVANVLPVATCVLVDSMTACLSMRWVTRVLTRRDENHAITRTSRDSWEPDARCLTLKRQSSSWGRVPLLGASPRTCLVRTRAAWRCLAANGALDKLLVVVQPPRPGSLTPYRYADGYGPNAKRGSHHDASLSMMRRTSRGYRFSNSWSLSLASLFTGIVSGKKSPRCRAINPDSRWIAWLCN